MCEMECRSKLFLKWRGRRVPLSSSLTRWTRWLDPATKSRGKFTSLRLSRLSPTFPASPASPASLPPFPPLLPLLPSLIPPFLFICLFMCFLSLSLFIYICVHVYMYISIIFFPEAIIQTISSMSCECWFPICPLC